MNASNIIYSSDLSTLRQLSEQAKENRYSISNIDSRKKETGDLHHSVDIVFSFSLDPPLILFDKFRMLELAEDIWCRVWWLGFGGYQSPCSRLRSSDAVCDRERHFYIAACADDQVRYRLISRANQSSSVKNKRILICYSLHFYPLVAHKLTGNLLIKCVPAVMVWILLDF